MHDRSLWLVLSLAVFAAPLAACEPALVKSSGDRYVEGEVLVKFRDGASAERTAAAKMRIGVRSAARVPLIGADAFELDGANDTAAALAALHEFSDVVEYAEPNFLYEHSGTPSDYDAAVLWGLARIDAPGAWDDSTGSMDVVVAVIDTGVDTSHPDLAANIWRNTAETANGVDDDRNGYVDDLHGWDFARGDNEPEDEDSHGTHIAGTIGAVGGNGGIVGVSPKVRIMPLKFMSPSGGTTLASIQAIDYARRNGATVINASWGSYGYSNALKEAIARAGQAGILFVAAAGNGDAYGRGLDADGSPMFPASYALPSVLSVAATDRSDELASFSNYGRATVDLAAPGSRIASTVPGGEYAYYDGTSMATPHVAGAAALLKAIRPELSVGQLRALLVDNVDRPSPLGGLLKSNGRLNIARAAGAAAALGQPGGGGGTPPPTFQWESASGGSVHPYSNDFDATWVATEPGASELKLRLTVDTEGGYDFVIVLDGQMNEIARYDGALGTVETPAVPGDTVHLRFVTDESVTGYGFEVSGFGWH